MSTENKGSADKLRAAATGQALAKKTPETFPQMLIAYKDQINMALPKHLNGDRMARVALTAFRQNPKLGECDPTSVFAAVVIASQLGLEIGINGQAYLVPYKQRNGTYLCQFIPGWRGLVDLVNRSGRAFVHTGAVYKGDLFEYEYGTNPEIEHKPSPDRDKSDPENLLYVYAWGRVKGADYPVIEVQSNLEVRRHRDRYNKVGDKHYSYENFEAYGRKVALMQVLKYMPMSIEHLGAAVQADYSADAGHIISMKDAIDGAFLPPAVGTEDGPVAEQTVDTKTGEIKGDVAPAAEETQGEKPPEQLAERVKWLKAADTEAILSARWTALVAACGKQGPEIDLEAARNERKDFIRARDERAKG